MSDGMSDSRALGSIAGELERAAHQLRAAIQRANDGHRGMSIDVEETVNEILVGTYYRVERKRDP